MGVVVELPSRYFMGSCFGEVGGGTERPVPQGLQVVAHFYA